MWWLAHPDNKLGPRLPSDKIATPTRHTTRARVEAPRPASAPCGARVGFGGRGRESRVAPSPTHSAEQESDAVSPEVSSVGRSPARRPHSACTTGSRRSQGVYGAGPRAPKLPQTTGGIGVEQPRLRGWRAMAAPAVRPRSAPALLRNEGMLAQRPHADAFLDYIENEEVKQCLTGLRWESLHVQKELSALADPGPSKSPITRSPAWSPRKPRRAFDGDARNTAADSQELVGALKKLSNKMHSNLVYHCSRLDAFDEVGLDRPQEQSTSQGEIMSILRNFTHRLATTGRLNGSDVTLFTPSPKQSPKKRGQRRSSSAGHSPATLGISQ